MTLNLIDFWYYFILNIRKHEKKLYKYQGYGNRTIIDFKKKNNLDWKIVKTIVENLILIDGLQLRDHIRNLIQNNEQLFNNNNTFFTHFGPLGKSGGTILNQFIRCKPDAETRIIGNEGLNKLPEKSNIIFFDDFIGTGTQALDYIYVLNYSLGASIKPYLFTICATNESIDKIFQAATNFVVKVAFPIDENNFCLLEDGCNKLTNKQKEFIHQLNGALLGRGEEFFNLNIPLAFYYSIPDNSLPLLWKNRIRYTSNNVEKEWYGLTPRDY